MSSDTHDQPTAGGWQNAFGESTQIGNTSSEPPAQPTTSSQEDYGTPPQEPNYPPRTPRPGNSGSNGGSQQSSGFGGFGKYTWLIAIGSVIVVVGVGLLSYFSWRNDIDNAGIQWQNDTYVKYQAVETELSTCLDNSLISSQIAVQERNSLKDILIGAASARYVNSANQPVDTNQALSAGVVINNKSIQENYPEVSDKLFQQLMSTAVGCRNQVAGTMEDLTAYAGRFKTWTRQGNIFEKKVRNNWPSNELVVTGPGGQKIVGAAALSFLAEPIKTADAAKALQTHTMPNQQLFPPTPSSLRSFTHPQSAYGQAA